MVLQSGVACTGGKAVTPQGKVLSNWNCDPLALDGYDAEVFKVRLAHWTDALWLVIGAACLCHV